VHQFLEIQTPHAKWIQRRIDEIGFVESVDYLLDKFVQNPEIGERPTLIFIFSLSMAKNN